MSKIDNIYKIGSKPIHSIAASPSIMNCIEGYKLIEVNEIVLSNHRGYLIDINLELYFSEQISLWNTINRRILNLSRRSHRKKFCKSIEI